MSINRIIKAFIVLLFFGSKEVYSFPLNANTSLNTININTLEIEKNIEQDSYTDETEKISMTLDECIKKALLNNPIIKKYYFDIKSQRELFNAARTKWLPTIQFEGDPALTQYYNATSQDLINKNTASNIFEKARSSSDSVNSTSFNEYDVFSLEQEISIDLYVYWNIIDATRTPSIKSEWELIKQNQNILKLTARKLLAEVTEAYVKAQGATKIIKELKPLIDISIESEIELKKQLDIGYTDIGQVSQAQTQVLNLLNTLAIAKGDRERYSAILTSLVSDETNKMIIPADDLKTPEEYIVSIEDAIKASIENNELSKAYIDEAESAEWSATAYENSYLPKLYLYLNWYYGNSWGISDADVNSPDIASNSYYGVDKGYYAGLGFTWDFDGGENIYNAKSKRANAQSLRQSAKSAELDFVGKTRENYIEHKRALQSIQIASEAVKTSKNNLTVLQLRSRYGLQDVTTTVQAFNLYNESLNQWIDAVEQANISLANLYRYTSTFPEGLDLDQILTKGEI